MENAVTKWFGDDFKQLHLMLQNLHEKGGELSGIVTVHYGKGMAGFIGRRVASKVGLPLVSGEVDFRVKISHSSECLFWNRIFSDDLQMNSIFRPHGSYKNGYWRESTGTISIDLGVEIIEGGWYWIQQRIRFYGITVPIWLLPSSYAYKKIVNDRYFFSVSFSFPLIGTLVSYSGNLDLA